LAICPIREVAALQLLEPPPCHPSISHLPPNPSFHPRNYGRKPCMKMTATAREVLALVEEEEEEEEEEGKEEDVVGVWGCRG